MPSDFKTVYQTIIFAPVAKVWEALTHPVIVKQYFFGTDMITDWEVGHAIVFRGEREGTSYEDKGVVQSYTHEQALSYSYLSNWSGKEDLPENYLVITYEVKALPEGTELTITQTNYDEEKAQHSKENWASLMEEMRKLVENVN